MRLLFAITVCCFVAVLWIALALARRIRLAQLLETRTLRGPIRLPAAPHNKQEFFEAGQFRTPRPLRLEQEILQQKPRRALSEVSFPHNPAPVVVASPTAFTAEPIPAPESTLQPELIATPASVDAVQSAETRPTPRSSEPIPIRPAAAYASLFGQTVQIARIDSHPRTAIPEILAPETNTAASNAAPRPAPVEFTLHRRPPTAARTSGLRRRIDLSHYNKDMGDLTDPYTTPLRGSGTQGPVPKNRDDR